MFAKIARAANSFAERRPLANAALWGVAMVATAGLAILPALMLSIEE